MTYYDDDWFTHIGLLVQNETGGWYHFYWGSDNLLWGSASLLSFTVKVKAYLDFCDFDVTNNKTKTLDLVNQSGVYGHDYEDMIYLEGDFEESYLYLESIVTNSHGKKHYNIYDNNCSQVSLYALSVSDTIYSKKLEDTSNVFMPKESFKQLKRLERKGGIFIPRAPISIIK